MYILLAMVGLYGVSLLYATKLWNDITAVVPAASLVNCRSVTVLIPFRNESENLPKLIKSFNKIDFPAEKITFLFIDDHSTDNSLKTLSSELVDFPFTYAILELPKHSTGKKMAQLYGIQQSKYELILCTDADCEVPANWVKTMQYAFAHKAIHMVTGNITFNGAKLWSSLMRVEFAPLIGITGVGISLNRPIMANGANMAFRKSSFLEVLKSRSDINKEASGDDIFLLEAIKKEFGNNAISFCKSSHVLTKPPTTLNAFFQQRIRWASKWKGHGTLLASLPSIAVWLFHFFLMLSIFYFLKEGALIEIAGLLVLKGVSEYIFIKSIFESYPVKLNVLVFILVSVFYSFYVILFGLTANFVGYKWKERAYG